MTRTQVEKYFGTWADVVMPFATSPEMDAIFAKIKADKQSGLNVYPNPDTIFRCFIETPLDKLRFVIIGKEPYPVDGISDGLAFSATVESKRSATLDVIYAAIEKDAGPSTQPRNNNLDYLCKQGGLLLNASLTIIERKSDSHKELWEPFTTFLIQRLQEVTRGILWFAWGKDAQLVVKDVDIFASGHFLIAEEHPVSSLYRAKNEGGEAIWPATCFSKANAIIVANRLGEKINW